MSCIHSDLEEGEIPDDSPSSPHVSVKKDRELPKRYNLVENKRIRKHRKRDCKNAIRHQAKKLAKLKKTPVKYIFKEHHKSRSRDRSHPLNKNRSVADHLLKNNQSYSKNSLISEINYSFKDILKNNVNPNMFSNSETHKKQLTPENRSSSPEIVEIKDKNDSGKKDGSRLNDSKDSNEDYIEISDDSFDSKDDSNKIKDAAVVPNNSDKCENEESEDEEELRRIALATCAKRKPQRDPLENLNHSEDNSCISEASKILSDVKNDHVLDNYEIVDMEVDEESDNTVEIINNENLFIIDTKPASELRENASNSNLQLEEKENNSDDDFETDILRAELIGSLIRKKEIVDEQLESLNENTIHTNQALEKPTNTYQKTNVILSPKLLQPAKQNGVNNFRKLKNSGSLSVKNEVNKPPKRFIITINNESSSSSEEESEEINTAPDNPVASIEALISDCRQKSDSNQNVNETVKPIPKSLSCLSKAQQEEYNSLMKILAEKEKLPTTQETVERNKQTVYSPLRDLKLLEEKLLRLKETLKKKKLLMASVTKDVNTKKQVYMKSKLSAQYLKEQYVAAEKTRRIKLQEWSKSCQNFEVAKKSVSTLESKITQIQSLCSKLNSSIKGQASLN